MGKFYTYIIQSKQNGRYYIGFSVDLEKRVEKHNAGGTASTRPYRPWELVYFEEFETKTEALKREKEIKKKKSRNYIEKIISKNSAD